MGTNQVATGFAAQWITTVRAVLVASDPALARLRMASRVTLTLLSVTLSLIALHTFSPLPVAAYGIAIITAMQGAIAIRDAGAAARAVTRVYSGIAGFLAVTAATMLSSCPIAADGAFVGLVFAAVYARKYGARWNAVGMFAFMCYFMGAYLRPAPADLPGVAAAIVLSAVIAHFIRNVVLPERREADFRRAIEAIGQRVAELAEAIRRRPRSGAMAEPRRQVASRREKMTDAILIAEGYLPLTEIDGNPDRKPVADLAVALFDLHLAGETAEMTAFRNRDITQAEGADDPVDAALRRLDRALTITRDAVTKLPDAALAGALAAPTAARFPGVRGGVIGDPALRLAIQVSLASAIAMTGGLMLSKTRWFWAILTAFLVFTNTQSRGDTAVRAINRALGTVAGIVVGIGLATLLHGQFVLSAGLAVLFVFTGFYLLQISYAAMTFFVTLVLSLLYGLLGEFTPGLLVLRLEETLVGVAAGIFIAFVVFPQSTTKAAGESVDGFLAALDDLLAAASTRLSGKTAPNLVALSRVLDRRYADLATVARPLGSNWQVVQKPGRVRQALLRFMALAHWARILARSLSVPAGCDPNSDLIGAIAALRAQIGEARAGRHAFFGTASAALAGSRRPEPRHADFTMRPDDPHFALDVLSHILDRAAHGGERIGMRADADGEART